ncbi:MAG: T9SS type A sorting domain-containing protein, partial [Candidatus Krumholzibacteria bacterium]|nr:T9SS type A sorting domain-containing protein [Candidatus Krumholzibacteria bacterium]
ALYQNVPNPFNPATVIRFDLSQATHVRLFVYNVKGELVSRIVDRQMTAGQKRLDWNAVDVRGRRLSSGMYFYRLTAGDFVQTRKMVLLR